MVTIPMLRDLIRWKKYSPDTEGKGTVFDTRSETDLVKGIGAEVDVGVQCGIRDFFHREGKAGIVAKHHSLGKSDNTRLGYRRRLGGEKTEFDRGGLGERKHIGDRHDTVLFGRSANKGADSRLLFVCIGKLHFNESFFHREALVP